jgi:hypothetical protein
MEKSVSFRFYKISRHNNKIPKFADALREIAKIKKKADREREVRTDCSIRLEELDAEGPAALVGEIIRVQKTNMPSEVHATGRSALSTNNPLGHGVTFRFNETTSTLCIQHEPRIASAGRLLDYVTDCWPEAKYEIKPLVKPKTWERFGKSDVKKIGIKIAQPDNLASVLPGSHSAASGLATMAEAYDAPIIKIELSMGHSKGFLNTKVKGLAKAIFEAAAKKDGPELRGLNAVAYIDDAREEVDLIEERIKVREDLKLDDRDPDKNYQIKKAYIKKAMTSQGL